MNSVLISCELKKRVKQRYLASLQGLIVHSFPDTGRSPLNKVLLFLSFQEALSRIGAKVSKIKGPEINTTLNGAQINPFILLHEKFLQFD